MTIRDLLTPRQYEVLVTYCRADTAEDAAAQLGIATSTLKNTVTTILRRLDCVTTRQAAYRLGREEHEPRRHRVGRTLPL